MKSKKVVLSIVLLFSFSSCYTQISTMAEAINKAGRQRMLTQRIAKDYMIIGLGSNKICIKSAQKEQIEAINLFQKQLEELLAFAPSKRIKIQYEVVKTTWKYYKELIKAEKDIESASKILDISNDILNACHKGVIMLEEYSGTEKSNLINISGRQRMLSQRIALYYIANKWGVKNLNIKRRFETSKKEFWIGLKTLISSDKNDSNIEFNLDLVKKKFRFAKKGYELDGDLSAQDIFRFTNDIQIKMNIITNMYENNIK